MERHKNRSGARPRERSAALGGGVWVMSVLLASSAPAQQQTAPAAKPAEITLADLAERRELWPREVALRKDVRLSGAPSLRVGAVLRLHDWTGQTAALDAGEYLFDLSIDDIDLLERARAAISMMTPEQFALTAAELAKRSELWPLRVALDASMGFDNGLVIPAGREVALRTLEGPLLSLYDRETAVHFQVETHETDMFERARARLSQPSEDPFFVRAVEAALVPAAGVSEPRPLAGADFILVYGGRLGCSRCEAFLPALSEFYRRAKAELDGFEVVFFSADRSAEDARAHLVAAKIPGRVVAYDRRLEAANLASIPSQLLPNVFLFDRAGNLLARNHPNGGSPSAADVLADLEKRLRARDAARK